MRQQSIAPAVALAPEDRARLSDVFSAALQAGANAPAQEPPRPGHALLPRKRMAAAALAAAGIIALSFALGGKGGEAAQPGVAAAVASALPKPVWIDITQPFQLYSLPAPELDKKPRLYTARRHGVGEGRQDALVFGQMDGHAPYVRLNIYRAGTEDAAPAAFFVELARRAADDGAAILRSGQPAPLATRFGNFEAAEAALSGPQGEKACLAYRLQSAAPPLRISGYACGADGSPIDRGALACILDRLDLVSAGDDMELRKFFVDAERRRGAGCGPGRNAAGAKAQPPVTAELRGSEAEAPPAPRKKPKA